MAVEITQLETKATKTIITFVGAVLTILATLGLPHPWDIIVGIVLGAGTTAGVFQTKNDIVHAEVKVNGVTQTATDATQ
jgi:hypothetical protein